jgi:casein kinase II subunit beta
LGRVYVPRIYGFKVSERARSGPRMKWLRERPERAEELDLVDRLGRWKDQVDSAPDGMGGKGLRGDDDEMAGGGGGGKGALFDDEDEAEEDEEEEEEEDTAQSTSAAGAQQPQAEIRQVIHPPVPQRAGVGGHSGRR